jgi:hypothetical protein
VVDARLRDEGVGEARLAASSQETGAQPTRTLPEAGLRPEQWDLEEQLCDLRRQPGVAQQLRQHDGR